MSFFNETVPDTFVLPLLCLRNPNTSLLIKEANSSASLPRFGAVGKHGSIAVVERFHRTFKELLRQTTIPEEQSEYEQEAQLVVDWYNEHRPHTTLDGKTPNEVYFSRPAANEQPRFEPRKLWPRGSPCAKPQVDIKGGPGDPVTLEIDWLEGRRHLPIIDARRAA